MAIFMLDMPSQWTWTLMWDFCFSIVFNCHPYTVTASYNPISLHSRSWASHLRTEKPFSDSTIPIPRQNLTNTLNL
jgi:hypothetical protein